MRLAALLTAVAMFLATPSLAADNDGGWTGSFNIIAGQRNITQKYWEPVESQTVVGMEAAFGKEYWPAHFLVTAHSSRKSADAIASSGGGTYAVTGTTVELGVGAKTNFRLDNIEPYLAAGVSWTTAKIEGGSTSTPTGSDTDSNRAGYFGAVGLNYIFFENFQVGGSVRILEGTEVNLFDSKGDADHIQYAFLFGWLF
ncbi:MAG: outer membrane beta-barrel protein [Nitrospinae bacterium]|nr:outer membrane beta-barrel protein [Nitrospinota bacterium]